MEKVLKRMWTFFCTSANISAFITLQAVCIIFALRTPLSFLSSPPIFQAPSRQHFQARTHVAQYCRDLIIIINLHYVRDVTFYDYYYYFNFFLVDCWREIVSLQYRWPIWWANAGNRLRGTLIYRCISLSLLLRRIIYHNNIMCY